MSEVRRDIRIRSAAIFIAVIMLFALIIYRIVKVQYFDVIDCKQHTEVVENCRNCKLKGKNKWRAMSINSKVDTIAIAAVRGNIYDTNGRLLAASVPEYKVRFDIGTEYLRAKRKTTDEQARFFHHVDTMAQIMAQVIGRKSAKEYEKILRNEWEKKEKMIENGEKRVGSPHYVFGKEAYIINYSQLEDELKSAAIYRCKQYESGLVAELRYKRRKPYDQLATSIIGSIFDENKEDGGEAGTGRSGIELRYEKELRGTKGYNLSIGGYAKTIEPIPGLDIMLTLDADLQHFTEQSLLKQLQTLDAEEGCAVLMDVKTGKIRAISNLTKGTNGIYSDRINIALNSTRAPGSVFKVISMMVALEDGAVQPDTYIDTGNGTRMFPWTKNKQRKMEDTSAHGVITASEVIQMSSNIGIADIINNRFKSNPQTFVDKIHATGLLDSLDFGIPAARARINPPTLTGAGPTFLPWLSMGYESRIPPVYTLMFYNAIANNGVMVKPHFVEKIGNDSIVTEVVNPKICSPETLKKLIPMMEMVVEQQGGTAFRTAKSHLFRTAGKTGTSVTTEKGVSVYQASFCGFFPADNPQYSAIVVVWKRGGRVYGGGGGGPVFKQIAEKAFLLGKRKHPALLADFQTEYEPVTKNEKFEKLSDAVGMGLRDAVYYLEKAGYNVSLNSNNSLGAVYEVRQNGKNVELMLN